LPVPEKEETKNYKDDLIERKRIESPDKEVDDPLARQTSEERRAMIA
jgi:hypothetical protein